MWFFSCSDPHSLIFALDFALGRSPRDTFHVHWIRHYEVDPLVNFFMVNYTIPDGIPAWVKIRAVNNGMEFVFYVRKSYIFVKKFAFSPMILGTSFHYPPTIKCYPFHWQSQRGSWYPFYWPPYKGSLSLTIIKGCPFHIFMTIKLIL